eukprot:GHUV01049892.1.p1 GENE.GHUV01049892.1~~GHUV01049892.1.p1  ORF type:complete len:203 (+),score=50.53 GHUV01049892.1:101-709(+)
MLLQLVQCAYHIAQSAVPFCSWSTELRNIMSNTFCVPMCTCVGALFEQELQKRNTYLLYACLPEPPPSPQHQLLHNNSIGLPTHAEVQSAQQLQKVVGYLVMQVNSITAHINKVAVAPNHRRKGIGKALLKAALRLSMTDRRALCATLHVDTYNAAALALYSKAGFQQDGHICDYYGPGKDAYKLLADLQESTMVAAFLAQQ